MQVISEANFPTSAGLASSAAGFAAIAYGLGKMFDLDDDFVVQLARFGISLFPLLSNPTIAMFDSSSDQSPSGVFSSRS